VQEVEDSLGQYEGKFALKALARGRPPQAYERFFREVNAVKGLDHPYIVQVVDSSAPTDDFHYYVMELVNGAKPLSKVLTTPDSPFRCDAVASLDLFIKVAEAILACETNDPKVTHRDLSPSNILLIPDGSIRVIDFGLCQVEGSETITLIDEGVGSVNYMAPECEAGASGPIDTNSDLYSAGKILWAAVAGQQAFAREKAAFTAKAMSKVFPECPDTWHLYHVFAKTIRHDPTTRWRSAQDAIDGANRVKGLIQRGYPATEEVFATCPVCGVGKLSDFPGSHTVFGNPNPRGIGSFQCDNCGVCLAIGLYVRKSTLDKMKAME
jgi:serine/threonine protein kinase